MNTFAVMVGLITAFVVGTILSFSVEGEFGIASTDLTNSVNESSTSIVVGDTTGFLNIDYVTIGNEQICYTGKTATTFTGVTRGCNNTGASSHAAGALVFNEASGVLNSLVGFNIAEAMSISGVVKVPFMVTSAFNSLMKILSWDYSYLEGTLWTVPLVYVKLVVFYPFSGAFSVALVIMLFNIFMGVARAITP